MDRQDVNAVFLNALSDLRKDKVIIKRCMYAPSIGQWEAMITFCRIKKKVSNMT